MRSFALSMLGLTHVATAQNLFESLIGADSKQYEVTDAQNDFISSNVTTNGFGMIVEESTFANSVSSKVIKAPLLPFHMDYSQQE